MQQTIKLSCARCESPLIQVSKETVKLEHSFSPMTTIKYICSNKECQDKADQRILEQERIKQERQLKKDEHEKSKLLALPQTTSAN